MTTLRKPKLVVFDLASYICKDVSHLTRDGLIYDAHRKKVRCYEEAAEILHWVRQQGMRIGVASRTSEIEGAHQLLQLLNWNRYITQKEIYPGSKVSHFERFKAESGIKYEDMLFFDDEYRNIVDVSELGVTCIHVKDGMTKAVMQQGLNEFAKKVTKEK